MPVLDTFGRPLRTLRVSVTDRCNLRCRYCMPEAEYVWLPRADLLTFEEIDRLVAVFVEARRRPAFGSPAASPCCAAICPAWSRRLAARAGPRRPGADDQRRPARRAAAALRDGRPRSRHRQPRHAATPSASSACRARASSPAVLAGIEAAAAAFGALKIDTVVIRGENDDELADLSTSPARARRRDPLHRVHGRRRRHQLVGLAGRAARRDPGAARARVRPARAPIGQPDAAPADALRAARRHVVRHHRLDHRAVLRATATAPGSPPTASC